MRRLRVPLPPLPLHSCHKTTLIPESPSRSSPSGNDWYVCKVDEAFNSYLLGQNARVHTFSSPALLVFFFFFFYAINRATGLFTVPLRGKKVATHFTGHAVGGLTGHLKEEMYSGISKLTMKTLRNFDLVLQSLMGKSRHRLRRSVYCPTWVQRRRVLRGHPLNICGHP
jgi:hypothetical protein